MALNISTIATALFEKIRNRFEDVSVGDADAKATVDPSKARFFNFDYVDSNGNKFGNVTLSLIDEYSIKVYYGTNLSANLDSTQKDNWYEFLQDLRKFAQRNMIGFDARDISRSNLNIKDLKQMISINKPEDTDNKSVVDSVTESKLYGTTKTSFKEVASGTKLIIRHSGHVDETKHGARSRQIESIHIEDVEGQRFKMPFKHIGGSCAIARHVSNGGQLHDDFGKHIFDLVTEMTNIRKFVQKTKRKTFEDLEAVGMVKTAIDQYKNLHNLVHKLGGKRGYDVYKESWKPVETLQDDINLEELKQKFMQKSFPEGIEDALPLVYRKYTNMKKEQLSPKLDADMKNFEESLEAVLEGTWALPEDDDSIKKLQELMSDPLLAGIDGMDATGQLYSIIGDDELFDRIHDAADSSPDVDVRPIVLGWLETHLPSIYTQVNANADTPEDDNIADNNDELAPAPEDDSLANDDVEDAEEEVSTDQAPPPSQEPEPVQEDAIHTMRRLAGLK
jgi:hypothetical protein